MAGRDDFVFPPERQVELAAGIPNARLRSSSAPGTTRRRSGPPRSSRPSETSSPAARRGGGLNLPVGGFGCSGSVSNSDGAPLLLLNRGDGAALLFFAQQRHIASILPLVGLLSGRARNFVAPAAGTQLPPNVTVLAMAASFLM